MYITISYTTTGYETRISFKRQGAFKAITVATADLDRALRNAIVILSNQGYHVQVNDGR